MTNDDDIFEIKDTTSHLYRIVPEVRVLILNALGIMARLPTANDKSKIDQAINALGYPLQSSGTIEPIAVPAPSVPTHSDPIKEATWRNTLDVIRLTVKREIATSTDSKVKEQLERILHVIPNMI